MKDMDETNTGKYKKVRCPKCGANINFATTKTVDFDFRYADNKVRCHNCGLAVKFSLKQDEH